MLQAGGREDVRQLSFFEADLEQDAGWKEAAAGCDYVLHIASPFPAQAPKDENELIRPAREGALRVLRAARDAGVKRVVMTSSFAAIGYGHKPQPAPFDETSWTNIESGQIPPYHKSKTLAERAAWEFLAKEGGELELTVINPVGIFGPVLGPDLASSIRIIQSMLDGSMPICPQIHFGAVDVRDVAALHLRAMTAPAAQGERFIATACESTSLLELAAILKAGLGPRAQKVPSRQMPNWLLRALAPFNPKFKAAARDAGMVRKATSEKARRLLAWHPRPLEQTIVETAESLLRLGLKPGSAG